MLAQGFDSDDLLATFGSLTLDMTTLMAGALDTLDLVEAEQLPGDAGQVRLLLKARNMLHTDEVYRLKLLGPSGGTILVDGQPCTETMLAGGIPLHFKADEMKTVAIMYQL